MSLYIDYMNQQKSVEETTNATESLIKTKLKGSNMKLQIESGNLIYTPLLFKEYTNSSVSIEIPSLDGISMTLIDEDYISTLDESTINESNNIKELSGIDMRNKLMSYYYSDDYYDSVMQESDVESIERKIYPQIAIIAETEDNEDVILYIKNSFNQNISKKLYSMINSQSVITVEPAL